MGILPVKDLWQRSLPGIVSELSDQLEIGSDIASLNRTGRKGRQQSDLGTCLCVSTFNLSPSVSDPVMLCSPDMQCVRHTNKQAVKNSILTGQWSIVSTLVCILPDWTDA